jgi:hypothetical protein
MSDRASWLVEGELMVTTLFAPSRTPVLEWRDVSPLDFDVDFDRALALYGVDRANVAPQLVCTTDVVLDGTPSSALPYQHVQTTDLDRFKFWIGLPDAYVAAGKALAQPYRPERAWTPRLEDPAVVLSADELHDVALAAGCYLFGDSRAMGAYRRAIETHLAPFDVAVYAVERLVIGAQGTLSVQGPPSVVLSRSVEIYHGGTLRLQSVARVVTDRLLKREG